MWYFYPEKNTSKAIQSKCSKKFSESLVHDSEFLGFINRPHPRAHLVLRPQFSGLRSDALTWDVNLAPDAECCLHGEHTQSLSYKTVLSSWFSLKTQDELSKAPDVNNGRRHNKQPLLSYHNVLTSNTKRNVVNIRDSLISVVQLHIFFIIHFNFVGLLFSSSPSRCNVI